MKANWKKIMLTAVLFASLALVVVVALFVTSITEGEYGDNLWGENQNSNSAMNAIYIDGEKYYKRLGVRNYLIMGIDGETEGYRGQADFIMIFSYNSNAKTYTMMSVNRDTMIEVDYYDMKGNKGETSVEQIALSHAYGDPFCASNKQKCENTALSVSRLLCGMKFDGYISMTMDAVKVIVDSLGGVEVLIEDNDLTAYDPSFVKGSKVTLNGELALKFVRARSGLEDATNAARMRRQETFLRALFAKLSEKSIESSFDFYDTISSKLVSNMYDTEQLEIVNKISEYEYQDSLVIDGEYRMGDKYWEFYASEDSIEQILIGAFYEKAN